MRAKAIVLGMALASTVALGQTDIGGPGGNPGGDGGGGGGAVVMPSIVFPVELGSVVVVVGVAGASILVAWAGLYLAFVLIQKLLWRVVDAIDPDPVHVNNRLWWRYRNAEREKAGEPRVFYDRHGNKLREESRGEYFKRTGRRLGRNGKPIEERPMWRW